MDLYQGSAKDSSRCLGTELMRAAGPGPVRDNNRNREGVADLFIIAGIILAVDLLLLYVARATFRREEIVKKWEVSGQGPTATEVGTKPVKTRIYFVDYLRGGAGNARNPPSYGDYLRRARVFLLHGARHCLGCCGTADALYELQPGLVPRLLLPALRLLLACFIRQKGPPRVPEG